CNHARSRRCFTSHEGDEMSQVTEAGPTRLPVPEGFPVEWADLADADRLWEREVMHVPGQTTALDDDLQRIVIEEGFNGACAGNAELAAHLETAVELMRRAWEIHFMTVFPVIVSMSLFEDLHRELLGADDGFEAYRLLQGQSNKSLEADRALYELSRSALAKP